MASITHTTDISLEIFFCGKSFPAEPNSEIVAEIEYSYAPATADYFSKSFGNWLPGDPEEIEVTGAKLFKISQDGDGKQTREPLDCPEWLADMICEAASEDTDRLREALPEPPERDYEPEYD